MSRKRAAVSGQGRAQRGDVPRLDVRRGEIWLVENPNAKPRPFVVLTRSDVIPVLSAVMAAPITRTIRDIPTHVPVGVEDGLRHESVVAVDNVSTVSKVHLTQKLAELSPVKMHAVCAALKIATHC